MLPCCSGSSEIWLASKVFTGEEVVVKRVSGGRESAFERERAVLKVHAASSMLEFPRKWFERKE